MYKPRYRLFRLDFPAKECAQFTPMKEQVEEGCGREKLIPSGLSVEGGRGGEEIAWWHAVVRQECKMMAAR